MRWRIYYGDGSTYGDGSPFLAPQTNVQIIAIEDASNPRGFVLAHGRTAYCWEEIDGWRACDEPGMWDYLLNYRGPKAILFGRSVPNEEWNRVLVRAADEGLGS